MKDRRQKYMSSLQPETMSSPDDISNRKLDLHFDITELDLLCAYVVSDNRSITRTGINNIKKIIDILDLNKYKDDIQSMTRINFIKKGISARIDKNLQSRFLIIKDILGGIGSGMMDIRELSNVEIDWVNMNITRILQTNYLRSEADNVMGISMETSNTGWLNNGQTSFISDPDNPISGTTSYVGGSQSGAPTVLLYLHIKWFKYKHCFRQSNEMGCYTILCN